MLYLSLICSFDIFAGSILTEEMLLWLWYFMCEGISCFKMEGEKSFCGRDDMNEIGNDDKHCMEKARGNIGLRANHKFLPIPVLVLTPYVWV